MSLENAQWIHELQKTNPEGTDVISQGDNHIRMIKEVLKDTFPANFDGPMIPDISGNAGKMLAVNEAGTSIEWAGEPTPPASPLNKTINRSTIQVNNNILTVGDGMYYIPVNSDFTVVNSGVVSVSSGSNRYMYIYIRADGTVQTDYSIPLIGTYGWFDGDNRCIGAVYQGDDSRIRNQYHDGGDYVMYGSKINYGNTYVGGWQTKLLFTPAFADRAQVTFAARAWGSEVDMFWRPTGTTESNFIASVEHNEAEQNVGSWPIYTGYQQTIDVNTGGESLDTYLEGYYLPSGM